MQDGAQEFPKQAKAGNQIIISAKNNPAFDEFDGQAVKQRGQVAKRINAYMRGQPVAQQARQVIDERDVAKAVMSTPVNAMRLEGVANIRDENHRPAARFKDPYHLLRGAAVVGDVFEDFVAENQVENGSRIRQGFSGGIEDVWVTAGRFQRSLKIKFQSKNRAAEGRQFFDVHANPAAIFQNFAANAFSGGSFYHFKAALLPGAPDVGRFAAQGGFFKVALFGHEGYYIEKMM